MKNRVVKIAWLLIFTFISLDLMAKVSREDPFNFSEENSSDASDAGLLFLVGHAFCNNKYGAIISIAGQTKVVLGGEFFLGYKVKSVDKNGVVLIKNNREIKLRDC